MNTGRQGDGRAIQDQMLKYELVEGLQRSIDNRYRRLFESAKQECERRFAGKDPSDACVSIRNDSITAETPAKALPRAGLSSKTTATAQRANTTALSRTAESHDKVEAASCYFLSSPTRLPTV